MIDLHAHILPALDDGAQTLDDALAIARVAADDGVRVMAATPHVREDYPTTAEEMRAGVAALREALATTTIELDVRPGGEIAFAELARLSIDELREFGLGGNPDYVLVEPPYHGWPLGFAETVFHLRGAGVTAVIAHPERNREVQADPARVAELVRSGALVQVTAASIDGRLGRASRACAERLLEVELAHVVASDAHTPDIRTAGLAAACARLGDDRLARWLTEDVPGAILDGSPLPPRPDARRRHGLSRLLRR